MKSLASHYITLHFLFHKIILQLKILECIFLWMISLVTGHVAGISLVHCVLHNLSWITKNGLKFEFTFFLFLWQDLSQDIYVNKSTYRICSLDLESITYRQGSRDPIDLIHIHLNPSHCHICTLGILGLAAHESSSLDLPESVM